MAKYDVGVLGVWYGQNYGSIATYYALHTILRSMGKTVLMLDKPVINGLDAEFGQTHSRKFAEARYDISDIYEIKNLKKLNQLCDAFLIGSDQLWNYGISRHTGKAFYLDFVDDEKKKIAFATSFGHGTDFAPPEERKKIASLMARFDGISLREDDGVRICREDYGINAVQVLDPVYVVDPSAYQPLINQSNKGCDEPYLATYLLDPTPEKREAVLYVAEKLGGIKIINLMDGLPRTFARNCAMLNLPNCIENLEVTDWLKYLSQAEFVITDSFHGASFSLIFRKNFIAIANSQRGISRFQSLGRLFHVDSHIVTDAKTIINNSAVLEHLDYSQIGTSMEQERERSYQWLEGVLNGKKKSKLQLIEDNVIGTVISPKGLCSVANQLPSGMCVGCGACVAICPTSAITFITDKWGYYRSFVNTEKCVNCGKCAQICPAIKLPAKMNSQNPECFEFASSDDNVLRRSSSGGAFTTIARMVLREGGAVVGAAWNDNHTVEHIVIENENELWKLQKSKYMQSYIGDTLTRVKQMLEQDRCVLFTGTPCQVAGLRAFLGKDYSKLIAMDIFCSNAPSAVFFKKYLEDSFPEGIMEYEFRYKKPEWNWDCYTIRVKDNKQTNIVRQGAEKDNYQRVFHTRAMCSAHCENCRYQALPRYGDLTIGDFWGISRKDPTVEAQKGVSTILVNNDKGKQILRNIPEGSYRIKRKVPIEWLVDNGYVASGKAIVPPASRNLFYQAITKMPFGAAVNYALKPNHGQFRNAYSYTNTPLRYDCTMLHFIVERDVWEELSIEGRTTLTVKGNRWKEGGHYARLSMAGMLKKGVTYRLSAKIKIRSTSNMLNFHIIDSGSRQLQVIHSEKIEGRNNGEQWIEFADEFTPDTDYYDQFMFGAAQVSGSNNFLTIAYLDISEL